MTTCWCAYRAPAATGWLSTREPVAQVGHVHTGQRRVIVRAAVEVKVVLLIETSPLGVLVCAPQNDITGRLGAQGFVQQHAADAEPLAFFDDIESVDLDAIGICRVRPEDRHAQWPASGLGDPHTTAAATQGFRVELGGPAARRTEQVEYRRNHYSGPGLPPNRVMHV